MSEKFNIASLLSEAAQKWPDKKAFICEHRPDILGRCEISYEELEKDSSRLASHLVQKGAVPGSRVIVMLKPGIDFVVVIFALFKAGLVPVMVDPGMGVKRMLVCLAETRPSGIVGIPLAHLLSLSSPSYFKSIKLRVTAGRRLGWGGYTLLDMMTTPAAALTEAYCCRAADTAAVLFTSGATGTPKGVVYTHAMFRAQVEAIKEGLGIDGGGMDLITFPMFGLFSPPAGVTSVFANIDPSKPGKADPRRIIEPLLKWNINTMFASPTILSKVAGFAHEHNLILPSFKRVITAGAPVQPRLVASFASLISPEAKLMTPYGATEGVPLVSIESDEIINETRQMTEQGLGMCVGRPLKDVKIDIIKITDKPIASFNEELRLPSGEIGEIIAQGPMVSEQYFERPKETAQSIIADGNSFWRRMGDVGWLDAGGRLWFCGRKNHRVCTEHGTLFSIPCEAIFNNHSQVKRCALVGVGKPGKMRPVIVVEPRDLIKGVKWERLVEELSALAKTNPRTLNINTFLKMRSLPVDVRHNAKINREKLAVWAANALKKI